MTIYTITVLLSVLAYIAVGNYAGRKVKGLEDYFVVGRQAPTILIVGTLVASFLSTNTFLGEAGLVYGFVAGGRILGPSLVVAGYIYGALYFGRYLRRSRSLTVAQYFADRFDSRRVQVIAGITVFVGIGFYLIAVTQGVAVILSDLTALSYRQGLIVAWASYTSFTLYSGSRGVVLTDTMMFFLFSTITVAAMLFIFDEHGGWVASVGKLTFLQEKPSLMTWHGMVGPGERWETPAEFLIWLIIIGIAWSFVTAISPWQSSRYLMAKDEHVVLRSACIAGIAIPLIQTMVYAAAVTVNLSDANIVPKERALIWAAQYIIPPLFGALVIAGLVAAALSSATTFLSLIGFNVSNDIIQFKHTKPENQLKFSRQMMLMVSIIALVVCLSIEQELFWLTYFAGTIFASAWGPVAFMSVWSDRITASAAFWGITTGFLGNAIPKLFVTMGLLKLPVYMDPVLIGAVISLSVVIIVSLNTEVTEKERTYRLHLLKTPEEEFNDKATNKTVKFGFALIIFGIVKAAILVYFYVVPYFRALHPTGQMLAKDWWSGEAWFAYSWSILYGILGCLVVFGVRKFYRQQS
ncbi:MAG: sodium:solute symporter [Opitutaceae bacterium]|nr:sodium:solute symporter [Opitutaceae bacterium]